PFSLSAVRSHLHSFPTRRSSDLAALVGLQHAVAIELGIASAWTRARCCVQRLPALCQLVFVDQEIERLFRYAQANAVTVAHEREDRKSTRLNSSHVKISYAVFCL